MKKTIVLTLMTGAVGLAGCGGHYEAIAPKGNLSELAPSGLVVIPKTKAEGYDFAGASVDTGGGSTPLAGSAVGKGKRFMGQIAQNATAGKEGGVLEWCVARPADFEAMCAVDPTVGRTTYLTGSMGDLRLRAFGVGYPKPPTSVAEFTAEWEHVAWVK